MKVGIDGVLLGAWADFNNEKWILDVGSGTGLLALMAAQRSEALIDAVEVEPEAASEALFNFQNSKWQSRIKLYVCSFQNLITKNKYDHIISNPPFFENAPKSLDFKRAQARHADSLTLKELLEKSVSLLTVNGKISLILPADMEARLCSLIMTMNLHLNRFCRIHPDETKKSHRILAELSGFQDKRDDQNLFIRNSVSGNYSTQYCKLTKDFYRLS